MKKLILLLLAGFISYSYAGGITTYNFILDPTVQKNHITIRKPVFNINDPYDFNKLVQCTGYPQIPINISATQKGIYSCTQSATLNLTQNEMYELFASIVINSSDGQEIVINHLNYDYDPWGIINESKNFKIYLNSNNQLKYKVF